MEYKILKFTEKNNISILTISRPKALNALNSAFFVELNNYLDAIEQKPDIKALIITGEGKAFVAGADISEMSDLKPEQAKVFAQTGHDTFNRLEKLKIPVIAAINGFALGGGCELSMACDIRIASSKAKFSQPEVNLGLIPGYAGTQRMAKLIGLGNALHLLLTGEMINADRAYQFGLVQKITEPENLMDETIKLAKLILSKGPNAIQLIKEVTRKGANSDFETGSKLEVKKFASLFESDAKEGMKAFLEKRNPEW